LDSKLCGKKAALKEEKRRKNGGIIGEGGY
jgi:hypothetical protein